MAERGEAIVLTLYTRTACPLCDHVVLALEVLRARLPFSYRKVDIDDDPDLGVRHGHRIPVLHHGEAEICAGQCDPATIESYLQAALPAPAPGAPAG